MAERPIGKEMITWGEESNIWICDMNIEGKAGGNICTGEYIRYNIEVEAKQNLRLLEICILKYSFDGHTFPSKHIAAQ